MRTVIALSFLLGSLVGASNAAGQSAGELTIYNQGFALIKQTQRIQLTGGRQSMTFDGVSAMIDPTSVGIRPKGPGPAFQTIEQNYRYDLIGTQSILNKSVGSRIRFVRTVGDRRESLEGVLISSPTAIVSANGGAEHTYNGMVIQTDDGRIVLDPRGEIEVQAVPPGLISRPSLVWTVDSAAPGTRDVDVSYVSGGFTWKADYVLTLNGKGQADLQGWVTVDNQSGTRFANATLKLLAGDVNVARDEAPAEARAVTFAMAKAARKPMASESLFEYHLYTVPEPTTLENRETKQISLMETHDLNARTRLRATVDPSYTDSGDVKPEATVTFANSKANHMGDPLPQGKFRVYQRDAAGSVQLLGESQIVHTPRDEKVDLTVGRAFDVIVHGRQTSVRRLDKRRVRITGEIQVRNRKTVADVVEVDLATGDGAVAIKSTTAPFVRLNSSAVRFSPSVAAGQTLKISYTLDLEN